MVVDVCVFISVVSNRSVISCSRSAMSAFSRAQVAGSSVNVITNKPYRDIAAAVNTFC